MIRKQNHWAFYNCVKYSIWTLYALTLMHIVGIGNFAFPDGNNPTCPSDDNGDKNHATCDMVKSLSSGASSLSVLASFILGGFLTSSRQLWLARRTAYCALCGATRNLLINVTTLAPPDDRKVFARWTILGYELSVLKGRMLIDTNEARHFLESSNLIIMDEWEAMVDGDRHTTVWVGAFLFVRFVTKFLVHHNYCRAIKTEYPKHRSLLLFSNTVLDPSKSEAAQRSRSHFRI